MRSEATGLRFSSSLSCDECKLAEETDGVELTEDVRAAFYAEEGRWEISVLDWGTRRTEVLVKLRALLNLSVSETAHALKARVPVFLGTLAEVEQVESLLKDHGAAAVVSRHSR